MATEPLPTATPSEIPPPPAVLADALPPGPPLLSERYAVVELMGHRRYVGLLTEVEVFGRRLGQVVHHNHDGTTQTVRFGGAAVFAVTDLTEAEFRAEVDVTAARLRPPPAYRHDPDSDLDDSDLERDMADARGGGIADDDNSPI